ncbi:MAG: pitrilysin family protein [Candidatus Zixiibacteriota bacterium]
MNSKEIYKKTILENGIRVVTEKIDYVRSISIGAWIDVGSRDEEKDEMGVSHFIEHMLFKGTKKRTAKEIASSLESVGGALNAFTSREHTCYFARVLDEHLDIALDVISDILKNALLSPAHFEKEKEVILSEIKELEDSPADLVHDLLMSTIWEENSLGRPIIGSADSVLKMTRSKLVDYMKRNYTCSQVVIAASGNLKHEVLVDKIRRKFQFSTDHRATVDSQKPPLAGRNRLVEKRRTAQIHVTLGCPLFPYRDKRRYSALVLTNILGGGMSSRLFQTVREKLGLAYSIYSFVDFFEDAGVFGIYLGTDKKKVVQVLDLVMKEITQLRRNSLSSEELSHAKSQLKGSLMLAQESTSNRMNRLARYELLLRDFVSLDETVESINKIRARDVISVAEDFLHPDNMSVVVLGPVANNTFNKVDWNKL